MAAVRYIRIGGDVKFSLLMSRYDNFHNNMFLLSSNKPSLQGGDQIKEASLKNAFAESLSKEADSIEKLAAEVFFDEVDLIVAADEMVQQDDGFAGIVEKYALPARS